jgi:hypothetical protein
MKRDRVYLLNRPGPAFSLLNSSNDSENSLAPVADICNPSYLGGEAESRRIEV